MNCSVSSAIPSASVDKAIAANPGFVMAHVLKGYLFGLATEPGGDGCRGVCSRGGATLGGTAREKAHVAALGKLARAAGTRPA